MFLGPGGERAYRNPDWQTQEIARLMDELKNTGQELAQAKATIEGLSGEPDPGYYVHWDKIVEKVGDAIGDRGYCQSPMELITTLIDQRDEHKAAFDGLMVIANMESETGEFKVTLDYDNYQDGARIFDGCGDKIGECYEVGMDPDQQFLRAIADSVEALDKPEGA